MRNEKSDAAFYISLLCSIAMIAVCFMPWVHYNSINATFTGYNVTKFASGVYYGRPGIFITIFAALIFLLALWKNNGAKRANLFLSAILFAYAIRTYILFTGAMFEGEVTKLAGIYLVVILPLILLVCSAFPKKTTRTFSQENK